MTGQSSDSRSKGGKHRDFIFYDPDPAGAIGVAPAVWRDFLRIHGDAETDQSRMSWPGHWRRKYRDGREIPVFYVQENNLLRIGLAYMLKLAGDFSTRDLLEHCSAAHIETPGRENGYDLADLLFGAATHGRSGEPLRGRVACETAVAAGEARLVCHGPTVLGHPKSSYFPNYLAQPAGPSDWTLPKGTQYVTYVSTAAKPILRGFKRYPVRTSSELPPLTSGQSRNHQMQVRLYALPAQTAFQGRIVFHNLKREELGALLWALTWGGNPGLRHSLGMAKPFGFGQVSFSIDSVRSRLLPNDPEMAGGPLDPDRRHELIEAFRGAMDAAVARHGKATSWEETLQMRNLMAMADPDAPTRLESLQLRHLRVDSGNGTVNQFSRAMKGGLVLADYAVATGAISPGDYQPPAKGNDPAPTDSAQTDCTAQPSELSAHQVAKRI